MADNKNHILLDFLLEDQVFYIKYQEVLEYTSEKRKSYVGKEYFSNEESAETFLIKSGFSKQENGIYKMVTGSLTTLAKIKFKNIYSIGE